MSAPSSSASQASRSESDSLTNKHPRAIHAIAYAPDGAHIATAHADNAIRIWTTESLQQVGADLLGHTARVSAVAYSPDGRRLLSASDDGTVRTWDTESHTEVPGPRMGHASEVYTVACSPDGGIVASGGADRALKLWDGRSGDRLATIDDHGGGAIRHIAFSPDGRRLATASDDHLVRIFNVEQRRLARGPLAGHRAGVRSVAYSPDGRLLASASADHTVRIWDAASGELHKGPLKSHKMAVSSVAFSADCQLVLSGSDDHTVCIWDVSTEKIHVGPLHGHDSAVTAAFSPSENCVVTGDRDGVLRIWDAITGKVQLPPLTIEDVNRDDDRKAAAARGMNAFGPVDALAWFPDGEHFTTAGPENLIRIWDARTGSESADPLFGHAGPVTAISISHDGKMLASGSADTSVRVWDAHTAEETACSPLRGHTGRVADVQFTPDGERVVSCGLDADDGIRIWEASTGEGVGVLERSAAYSSISVCASADGTGPRLAGGSSADMSVSVWDLDSRERVAGPWTHDAGLVHVSISPLPDGPRVLSCTRDGKAYVWDVARGNQVLFTAEVHGASALTHVHHVLPRRLFLSVGAGDTAVCVWRSTLGAAERVGALVHDVEVDRAVLSPDARRALTACRDGSLRVWDVESRSVVLPRACSEGSCEDRKLGKRPSHSADDDDSIMNMPAVPRKARAQRGAPVRPGFFDLDDDEPDPKTQRDKSPVYPRANMEPAPAPRTRRRSLFEWSFASLVAKIKRYRPKSVVQTTRAPLSTRAPAEFLSGEGRAGSVAWRDQPEARRRSRSPESHEHGPSSLPRHSGQVRRAPSHESGEGRISAFCLWTRLPFCR